MIEPDIMTPEAELQALTDLVDSDGWRVYRAHLERAWGDAACLDQIDQALAGAHSDDELAITKRIRDTFKGVRAEAAWVEQRISELTRALKRKPVSIVDRFTGLRRVPR